MKGFMFVVAVAVFALLNTASAQVLSGDANILTVDISAQALQVTGQQAFTIAGVPGTTYNYFYDVTNAVMAIDPPDAGGNVNPGDNVWAVVGTPLSNVIYTFLLPGAFVSAGTGGVMPITYSNTSAVSVDGDGNAFAWNPKNPSPPINLGSAGGGSVFLGFSFNIPVTAPAASDYNATFYLSAQATGF
jgi:hypothetical protein